MNSLYSLTLDQCTDSNGQSSVHYKVIFLTDPISVYINSWYP